MKKNRHQQWKQFDYKKQYSHSHYYKYKMQTSNFCLYQAIDSFPSWSEAFCHIRKTQKLSNFYVPLIEHIRTITMQQLSLSKPQKQVVAYLRQANKILQQVYTSSLQKPKQKEKIVKQILFGQNIEQYEQFYKEHIDTQKCQELSKYQELKLNDRVLFSQNFFTSSYSQQKITKQTITNKIKQIPVQVGDGRLQPFLKTFRELQGIYGIKLVGSNLNRNQTRSIIIKFKNPQINNILKPDNCPKRKLSANQDIQFIANLRQILIKLISLKKNYSEIVKKCFYKIKQRLILQLVPRLIEINMLTGNPYPQFAYYNIQFFNQQLIPYLVIDPYLDRCLGFKVDKFQPGKNFIISAIKSIKVQQKKKANKLIVKLHSKTKSQLANLLSDSDSIEDEEQQQQYDDPEIVTKLLGMEEQLNLQKQQQQISLSMLLKINQKLNLNSHISDLSLTKPEYVLWMRYKILQLMIWYIVQCNKIDTQINIDIKYFNLLMYLITSQFRQVLRPEDQQFQQQSQKYCKIEIIKNLQHQFVIQVRNREQCKQINQQLIFLNNILILLNQLTYVHFNSTKPQGQKVFIHVNYSKQVRKISIFLKNKVPQKIASTKQRIKCFPLVYGIVIDLIIKMDHNNIYQCDYFYFRKLKTILSAASININQLERMYNRKEQIVVSDSSLWSGVAWPQSLYNNFAWPKRQ